MFSEEKYIRFFFYFTVVVNGDLGTGKTSLIKNFCEGSFTQAYTPTVGVDYGFKIEVISDVSLRVRVTMFSKIFYF